jgi:AraC-like DNA-binding protein
MTTNVACPPVDGTLVESVVLVDQLTRSAPSRYVGTTLPGHLLHVVTEGEVLQEIGGRRYRLEPGTAVWYHEDETVYGQVLTGPWVFYTVSFRARRLAPPPFEHRVWPTTARAIELSQLLLNAWRDLEVAAMTRQLRVLALMTQLLLELLPSSLRADCTDAGTDLWWDIEARVREDLSRPIDIRWLQDQSGRSQRSIIRACQRAVGSPPMKRIKRLRLSYARGLVLYGQLSLTDIAFQVGYSRVQELSRDYRRQFGVTPTEDRKAGPDYRDYPPRKPPTAS